MIAAAILASGESRRMGRSKALLPAGRQGPSFVKRLSTTMREAGLLDILVVGRPADGALRTEVDQCGAGVRFIENHHADGGQISSIVAAVDAVDHPGVSGLLVMPVDQPLVAAASVVALIDVFLQRRPPIARATHAGRHGHPVIFAPVVFNELRHADRAVGARVVLRAHHADLLDVEVPDSAVLVDIDDPAEFVRLFGALPDQFS